jgi:hypothetical protein
VSILSTLIQHSLQIPSQKIRQEEEIKGIQIGNEVAKLSQFSGNMILYIKDPKTTPKTPRCYKQSQQSNRIQNQFAKISSLFIQQQ